MVVLPTTVLKEDLSACLGGDAARLFARLSELARVSCEVFVDTRIEKRVYIRKLSTVPTRSSYPAHNVRVPRE